MTGFLRVWICLAVALSALVAQDSKEAGPKLNPAIQRALDRIAKGETVFEKGGAGAWDQGAQSTWARSMVTSLQQLQPPPAERACSVPLLEMQVEDPERFTMQRVPPPANNDRMPRAIAPAPPCDKDAH